KQTKKPFKHFLHGARLVIDARLAGLRLGLLNDGEDDPPPTMDNGEQWQPPARFRVRVVDAGSEQTPADPRNWRARLRIAIAKTDEGEPSKWLIVDKWLDDATTEEDRSIGRLQLLDTHQRWAERRAR